MSFKEVRKYATIVTNKLLELQEKEKKRYLVRMPYGLNSKVRKFREISIFMQKFEPQLAFISKRHTATISQSLIVSEKVEISRNFL